MDYVIIEDGCKLDAVVACFGVKISERCQLKDCEIGGGYVMQPDTQCKGGTFQ